MHMRTYLVAAMIMLYGCRTPGGPSGTTAPGESSITSAKLEQILGRPFLLITLQFKASDSVGGVLTERNVLNIQGDQRHVSFASKTPPFTVGVAGNTVQFGGHTFEVTALPGSYVVDGQSLQLSQQGLHVFQNGKFAGTRIIP